MMKIQNIPGKVKSKIKFRLINKLTSQWFLVSHFTGKQRDYILKTNDPVRYGTILLAAEQIKKEGIFGDIAECGIYKGITSKVLHEVFSDRKLFLFDTFEGFDNRDSDSVNDPRFKDTSVEAVLRRIGSTNNIFIRKGYFPDTSNGLENESFAFVMVDFDKYEPTIEALKFFYPRLSKGGFIFVHDYNNAESNFACSKALDTFSKDIPEKIILIPDCWGSAFFRKL
jgi:O-methyltransferase